MYWVFIILLVSTVFANQAIIDEINAKQNLWVAGPSKFDSWTNEEIKQMLNPMITKTEVQETLESVSVPDSFEFYDNYDCFTKVMDQAKCGSCWAFGTATSTSTRYCKKHGKKIELSPQDLVSCDWEGNSGCNGGQPRLACDYVEFHGIVDDTCYPYTSGGGDSGKCKSKCADKKYKWKLYKDEFFTCSGYESESAIQKAIYEDGPVCGTMAVFQDFMSYTGGIYKHTTGELLGGHAITIVGWGEEEGTKFWKVQNSWGPAWGESGFFRIVRGENNCGIDSGATAGKPK
ncbi:hypothetical protein M0813_24268 [Anaeramoeba flamelloides]|uniref:Peptidase C1A papain C-terminal domain-containing protein n=1 Tax=Anaeramoeba flamelloides TaxID=1746091 RepID=A0ABQ8Y693_9EUKA|nr:hypothetical protein M0813_24268 [Anaeramoeba flamelloides]